MRGLWLLLALGLLPGSMLATELAVVVHPARAFDYLTPAQVIELYTGRRTQFPDGHPAYPLDQAAISPGRAAFYQHLMNKSLAQINAYWARLLFTGRAEPPEVVADDAAVLQRVASDPAALGYVTSDAVDRRVKIVLRLPSSPSQNE